MWDGRSSRAVTLKEVGLSSVLRRQTDPVIGVNFAYRMEADQLSYEIHGDPLTSHTWHDPIFMFFYTRSPGPMSLLPNENIVTLKEALETT